MNTEVTSISLRKDQIIFFEESNYTKSKLIRKLIDDYPEFKEWRERQFG